MRRFVVLALVFVFLSALATPLAFAGVEPSPFQPPGMTPDIWTAPGQFDNFDPQPEAPAFSVKGQWIAFDPQPEPPGKVKDIWTAPGQFDSFDPQPMPPAFTPVMQTLLILN